MKDPSPPPYQSGFAAVLGKPNVGKSSLLNALLGQKIAAVTPRPQTTRKRQMGILTLEGAQVVFVDTPGVHQPRHKLGEAMNQEALATLEECDLILFIVDGGGPPDEEDRLLAKHLAALSRPIPALLLMNKCDLVAPDDLPARLEAYQALLPQAALLPISARRGDNLDHLLDAILERLPGGAPFFAEDQVTDLYERDLAADLIREAALILLRDEVPHGIAIRIDQFTERAGGGAYIEATLFVEKESHKGIVIGAGGGMLKQIGAAARHEIEAMSGRSIFLSLRVKVRKNWRDDEKVLHWFGY
ncbi:MAG: GTPase Era [Chloroflexi bacterium]|nr:GTPase Era [Chloroflexota bacterium]